MTLCLSWLFLIVLLGRTSAIQGYASNRTCQTTADCLAQDQNQWCKSGQICVHQRCHTVPDFPCKRGEFCMEREKKCFTEKVCQVNEDCNDSLYCNGEEQCIDSRCQNNDRSPCTQHDETCYELNKTCVKHISTTSNDDNKQWLNSVAPSTVPINGVEDLVNDHRQLWTILFIVACALGGIAFVFYIVTGAARPAVPTSVMVITTNPDGDDADNGRARELLSRSSFQQTIHY